MAGHTPAGWYSDPEGDPRQRYWDGFDWTDDFRDARPSGVLRPVDGLTVAPPPSERPPWPPNRASTRSAIDSRAPSSGPSAPADEPPWWREWWAIAAFAVIALILGGALGASAGSSTDTATVAGDESVQFQTVTETETTRAKPKTVTVTSGAPQPPGGGSQRSFAGNGYKGLGTITVDAPSTLRWNNDGAGFELVDAQGLIRVDSTDTSGEAKLAPGTYTAVTVDAVGNWTIEIVPD